MFYTNKLRFPFLLAGIVLAAFVLAGCDQMSDDDQLDIALSEALNKTSNGVGAAFYTLPTGSELAAIPQDPRNRLTPAKVELGKLLFHETALATNPRRPEGALSYSCASCHPAHSGFASGTVQAIAEGGIGFGEKGEQRRLNPVYARNEPDVQPLRAPRTVNVAYQKNMLWGGAFGAMAANFGTESRWSADSLVAVNRLGYEGVETQAIAGQMFHRMSIKKSIIPSHPVYQAMFEAAFPELPASERINNTTSGLAISSYVRSIVANEAPFQKWLRGQSGAMTADQKRGAVLFFGKARCFTCHNGPALTTETFHALGMPDFNTNEVLGEFSPDDAAFLGRGGFTGIEKDNYTFKTPQLYNLADSPFFGHGSSFRTIREVVEYFNRGVPMNPRVPQSQISSMFKPLNLSTQEVEQLTAFVEEGLRDPDMMRYFPDSVPSGNCFPNNDPQTRADRGC